MFFFFLAGYSIDRANFQAGSASNAEVCDSVAEQFFTDAGGTSFLVYMLGIFVTEVSKSREHRIGGGLSKSA